jgi:hypothetical protein
MNLETRPIYVQLPLKQDEFNARRIQALEAENERLKKIIKATLKDEDYVILRTRW